MTTLPDGSAVPADGGAQQRRYWRQPTRGNPDRLDANGNPSPEDVPHIYDTWVQGDRVVVSEALCDVCGEPFDSLIIGGVDERFDSDNDGIFDFDEDRDRDGVVDPNESDPRRVDTDADGLLDRDGTPGVDEPEQASDGTSEVVPALCGSLQQAGAGRRAVVEAVVRAVARPALRRHARRVRAPDARPRQSGAAARPRRPRPTAQ